MLSPHPTVQGPLPKHTPVLINALRTCGCEVSTFPWGRHGDNDRVPRRIATRLRDVRDVRRLVAASHFDVLVVKTSHEWPSLLRDLPLLAATRRVCPRIVLQFHGGESARLAAPGSRAFKAASRLLFKLSDGVLFLSSEELRAAAAFRPDGRYRTVINPYVAAPAGEAPGARAERGRIPTLLFVGRLVPEKGVLDAIEAFRRVRQQRPCRLIIVGTGPAGEEVRRRSAALRVAGDVVVAGQLSAEALHTAYRDADIFLLPTYWPEGFPTVITEAMVAGLPVITTQMRGMADHLQDRVNALFVPPSSPEELAAAIARLLDDGHLRAAMGSANSAKAREFAPPVAARLYLDALEAITGLRAAA